MISESVGESRPRVNQSRLKSFFLTGWRRAMFDPIFVEATGPASDTDDDGSYVIMYRVSLLLLFKNAVLNSIWERWWFNSFQIAEVFVISSIIIFQVFHDRKKK